MENQLTWTAPGVPAGTGRPVVGSIHGFHDECILKPGIPVKGSVDPFLSGLYELGPLTAPGVPVGTLWPVVGLTHLTGMGANGCTTGRKRNLGIAWPTVSIANTIKRDAIRVLMG